MSAPESKRKKSSTRSPKLPSPRGREKRWVTRKAQPPRGMRAWVGRFTTTKSGSTGSTSRSSETAGGRAGSAARSGVFRLHSLPEVGYPARVRRRGEKGRAQDQAEGPHGYFAPIRPLSFIAYARCRSRRSTRWCTSPARRGELDRHHLSSLGERGLHASSLMASPCFLPSGGPHFEHDALPLGDLDDRRLELELAGRDLDGSRRR